MDCCISIFGIFINGWMFTDGYIAAIRNLGLARFRLAIYAISCKKCAKVADTYFIYREEIITNTQFLFTSFSYQVPQKYEMAENN